MVQVRPQQRSRTSAQPFAADFRLCLEHARMLKYRRGAGFDDGRQDGSAGGEENHMNFQIDVSSALSKTTPEPPPAQSSISPDVVDLLRQILEVQREQLTYQRNAAAAHDMTARWRSFLARWQHEFPELSDACRRAIPHLERCYGQMISDLTERLSDEDPLDNDFAVQEFLDRYGMRLAQLGTILNLVAPLAEAGSSSSQGESS